MERHVRDLFAAPKNAELVQRCAVLDVVSWFPGVLRQVWIDVSVRWPHAERYDASGGTWVLQR